MTERCVLIEIQALPDPVDQRELLELVLAAASLELSITVLLGRDAVDLFQGAAGAGWRQLLDHDLARVGVIADPASGRLPSGLELIDERQREKLARECVVIRA
ncbi:MAG: hypothetical protein ACLFSC_01120 [Wenzhouxiangella sp.]